MSVSFFFFFLDTEPALLFLFFFFFPFLKRLYLALDLKHLAYLSRHSATPVPFLLTVWWLLLWEWFLTQNQHESKPNRNTTGRTRSTSGYFAVLFTLAKKVRKALKVLERRVQNFRPRPSLNFPRRPNTARLLTLSVFVLNGGKYRGKRKTLSADGPCLCFFFNNTIILMRS